jgi:thioredoxin 1
MTGSPVITVVTEDDAEELLAAPNGRVLIEFGSRWCSACRSLEPALAAIARERAGAIIVGQVDVLESETLAKRFDVRSLPTLLLLRDGTEVARILGARSKRSIDNALAAAFDPSPYGPA